ncbi:Probable carboxyvinyl-carboxyphosphonate phosphorylmutase [hydrothermal vent metagenome]|uniref:Probable carboxyvinyl-carboxyphosphonate phosphorylmutase n=1 Tax=hydrothermal vent metagenome TaxID=652676 RepID=A0A3B0VH55_9ZZZZ
MNKYNTFKNLHQQDSALLLGNVWNVQSAVLFQKLGFQAIGTSSAAIATSLGYEDGEKMPFVDLLRIVKNIQSKINIPLTVDIEGGYSRNTAEIITNIIALQKLGVVGINIEDAITNTDREIVDAQKFGKTIQVIKAHLLSNKANIFLNVRTDSYIMGLNNPLAETLKRIQIYEESGADGIFVPCIVAKNEIKKVVETTALPVNIMCMPDLPSFNDLQDLGVKRISAGPFLYNDMIDKLEKTIVKITKNQSFKSIFT